MLRALCRYAIGRMEREWTYDASYLRDLAAASPWTFLKFAVVTGLPDRRAAPADLLAAVGIVGTLSEDCGPCTQIGVDMAERGGVRPQVLRAILAGDRVGMGETAVMGYDFARAVLDRDLETADALRDSIARRWGMTGLVAATLVLTTSRMYPTLKYGLGHGRSCSKIVVAGQASPIVPPMGLAA